MKAKNTLEMLSRAQQGGYAVGAFNVENLEMAQGVLAAAAELHAPVILQTTPSTVKYASPHVFAAMLTALAEETNAQAAIHLDHGDSVELCRRAADSGYTSIMFDGSKLPLEENIRQTALVAAYNRTLQLSTEAELGTVGGKEDSTEAGIAYTDPDEAVRFAAESGATSLAVAIGTAHGFYHGDPKLDFQRLQVIRGQVSLPLVLHGASGLSDADIRRAVELGISKINFATELRCVYTDAVRAALVDTKLFDPKKFGAAAREAVKRRAMEKIVLCGCGGKG
ncbi:MAG: class II fructose-bisphosphate aldolase [Candidatus Limiplasma sp.]|nr:class II fructose-bisphosphate aldolase [Candidatus Limiplasma sp.]